jgi:hypothetical protein
LARHNTDWRYLNYSSPAYAGAPPNPAAICMKNAASGRPIRQHACRSPRISGIAALRDDWQSEGEFAVGTRPGIGCRDRSAVKLGDCFYDSAAHSQVACPSSNRSAGLHGQLEYMRQEHARNPESIVPSGKAAQQTPCWMRLLRRGPGGMSRCCWCRRSDGHRTDGAGAVVQPCERHRHHGGNLVLSRTLTRHSRARQCRPVRHRGRYGFIARARRRPEAGERGDRQPPLRDPCQPWY